MDTVKRFRKILTAGTFAAVALVAVPAISNAAVPGPGDLQANPCAVITHGCESTPQDPDDRGTPTNDPGVPGPDDFTSATTVPVPTDHPTEDPNAADDAIVVQPRYNG